MHNIYSLYAENENIIGTKPLSIVDRLVCRQRQPKHYTPQLANLQITTMFEFSFALLLERHTHTHGRSSARDLYICCTRARSDRLLKCAMAGYSAPVSCCCCCPVSNERWARCVLLLACARAAVIFILLSVLLLLCVPRTLPRKQSPHQQN